jgi:hypothetical protein
MREVESSNQVSLPYNNIAGFEDVDDIDCPGTLQDCQEQRSSWPC